MENKDFNKGIKDLRIKKGLSQEELANLSGLSLRTVQRIENDETNPIGDTKRKIIQVLESYPDMDIRNTPKAKKGILQRIATKYKYLLIIFIFSILGILIGLIVYSKFLFTIGLAIGFLCLIVLSISTAYHIEKIGWKNSLKYSLFTTCSIIIYISIISLFIPVRIVRIETINGETISIEKNLITGKSDTTRNYRLKHH